MDISETLAPKSDQLDNIDLRGSDPRAFTVTSVDVKPGSEQPVTVHLAEFPRPWKPGKNMRRVLAHYWGRESDNWVGKRVELFSDERVKFGNETPGGTRISRMSHIEASKPAAPVMLSQGRAGTYKVDPLPELTTADRVAALKVEWRGADADRRKAIEAEVAALTNSPAPESHQGKSVVVGAATDTSGAEGGSNA